MATSIDLREEPSENPEIIHEPIVEVLVVPSLGDQLIESQAEDDLDGEVISQIYSTLLNWTSLSIPDLLDYWRREDIDFILMTVASDMSVEEFRPNGAAIIRFLAASGYRDEPPLDEAGRPIEGRVTALHRVDEARYSYDTHTDTDRQLFRDLFLIYDRFDVNYVDPRRGWSHFRAACEFGLDDVVEKFLVHGRVDPDLGLDPDTRWTHLQTAMYHEHWRTVELLLRHGAEPNLFNEGGYALLHHVAMTLDDKPRKVELLFETCRELGLPVEVDALDDARGETPFHHAVENGNLKIAESLLRHGADPSLARRLDGRTPLHIVCETLDFEQLLRFLKICPGQVVLEQIRAWDKPPSNTPLHLAAERADARSVELLLRLGADPNAASETGGETPLHRLGCRVDSTAEMSKWKATVLTLLRYGADPNLADGGGRLPLHRICEALGCDALREFLEACDETRQPIELAIDARDNAGQSPLHSAARWADDARMIELLLRRGADAKARDSDDSTPLHLLCQRTTEKTLKRYFHEVERYHWDDDRLLDTLFRVAEELSDERVSIVIDARDGSGRTALQLAVANLKPNCVRALLSHGADLASFLFPTEAYFAKTFEPSSYEEEDGRPVAERIVTALKLASSALACVEHLESSGRYYYELDHRDDLLTIVKFFREHGLFRVRMRGFDDDWPEAVARDPELAQKAGKCMLTPCLSLHDLTGLGYEAAARLVAHAQFCKFDLATDEDWKSDERLAMFLAHLLARMSAGFFRRLRPLLDDPDLRWLRRLAESSDFYRACEEAIECL
ncbi:hypothetical protein TKK_0005332 [Trichogramma kaykai]|uniref:Uncharacterized protein n=1 Tax=Trichogramma kaykai TaxID=54128 RepID=A0ABD2XIV5_9HYME